ATLSRDWTNRTGLAVLLAGGAIVLISLPVILPVKLLLKTPHGFFVVFGRGGLRRGERLLAQNIAEALEVQFVDPIFYRQLPLLFGVGPGANERVRPEAEAFGHGNIVLVEPAELLSLRPAMSL